MPPETKPVINSLVEMTCENCIYSTSDNHAAEGVTHKCHEVEKRLNSFFQADVKTHFCSKGKWMTSTPDYNEPDVTNYDLCYKLFRAAKCNT